MDFTREPIVETVITPKEGCKLVLRNSKNTGQEEYFVDAVEVVSFGSSFFFRSMERPKAFLVPVADYEILEVRETRMVLRSAGSERSSIKIGGGREAPSRQGREASPEKEKSESEEPKPEKKRDRRRHARRKRGREDKDETKQEIKEAKEEKAPSRKSPELKGRDRGEKEAPVAAEVSEEQAVPDLSLEEQLGFSAPIFSTLLPPPSRLISETISEYREDDRYKGAFFEESEDEEEESTEESSEEAELTEEEVSEEQAEEAEEERKKAPAALEAENAEASEEICSDAEMAVEEVANGEHA